MAGDKSQMLQMDEHFNMTGGEGEYSYAKNSAIHKESIDLTKELVVGAILENLDIKIKSPSCKTVRIADLGCSTGPNTFISVTTIIEGVTSKYRAQGGDSSLPEFHVFFNDHVSNDFNTLFRTLPEERQYYVGAVPGSFHTRLFPPASVDIFYSSFALQWLSKVPEELRDVNSGAFNKGRILYAYADNEVGDAYAGQYAKDMQSFLSVRAQEVVPGGLVMFLIPSRPDGIHPTRAPNGVNFRLPMESTILDMVNEGVIDEAKLDGFNIPMYSPSGEELRSLIEKNGYFSVERMDKFKPQEGPYYASAEMCRSGFQDLLVKQFGEEVMEELFDRYARKIPLLPPMTADDFLESGLFVMLKRNI